jgi:hypothetical protein
MRIPADTPPVVPPPLFPLLDPLPLPLFLAQTHQLRQHFSSENLCPSFFLYMFNSIEEHIKSLILKDFQANSPMNTNNMNLEPDSLEKICRFEINREPESLENLRKLLKLSCSLLKNKSSRKLYKSLDVLLVLMLIIDDLAVIDAALNIIFLYFSDSGIRKADFEYLKSLELLLFVIKSVLNHQNTFQNHQHLTLVDYFFDDPKFSKLQSQSSPKKNIIPQTHWGNREIFEIKGHQICLAEGNFETNADWESSMLIGEKIGLSCRGDEEKKRIWTGLLWRVRLWRKSKDKDGRLAVVKMVLTSLKVYGKFNFN